MKQLTTGAFIYFLLLTTFSYSQDKKSSQVHKTKSSATINGAKYLLHTVEKGQTLFAIAKFYKKDLNEIVSENPETINGIKPGQVLRIPLEKKQVAVDFKDTSNYITHTVEKGETIYSISKKYNLSNELLKTLNPELKDGLKMGQVIKIPSLSSKPKTTGNPGNISQTENKIPEGTSYAGELKNEYSIALFLPFNISAENPVEVDKIVNGTAELPIRTAIALQFYEGALLAIDTLKKQKFNAKIFVYDVDDKDSSNLLALLKKPELAKTDLIIGPLYASSFMPVAKFAKEHMIPIVSPFTLVNKILFNNPYVCKVSPSTVLQVEQMAHYVIDTFKNENIILVNTMNQKYASFYNAFRKIGNDDLIAAGKPLSDSLKLLFNVNLIESMLSTTKTNVIALPSNDQSYVSDFISKLHMLEDKYKIVLIGMQSWITYDNMDYEYLNRLSLHVPSNGFVDYSTPASKWFIKKYQDRFKTTPDMYGFQGYDVTYYFLSSLQKFGSGFLNNIKNNEYKGIETGFRFSQFPADSGFENQSVLILKYQNYQLIKALR